MIKKRKKKKKKEYKYSQGIKLSQVDSGLILKLISNGYNKYENLSHEYLHWKNQNVPVEI